ncbi:MAG: hypothetical protein ACM3VT_20150 [Solirubrobacterales bacterium]
MKRTIALGFAVGLIAILGTTAQAVEVTVGGGWYEFYWGVDESGNETGDPWNAEGPFTFTADAWTVLKVTDVFVPGDQFEVYNGGIYIGTTSVPVWDPCLYTDSYDYASSNPPWSSGTLTLAPGSYSLTLFACIDPYGWGAGGLRVDVSESPVYTNYEVIPVDATTGTTPVTLIFTEMIELGETSLVTSQSGPACPTGYRMGEAPTYYALSTAATYTPPIGIAIDYSSMTFSGPQNKLRLLQWVNEAWVDCTLSVDAASQTIFGQATSLSTFIVVEPIIHVEMDIRPSGRIAHFDRHGRGVIPVVIFGSADVDAAQIDPLSLCVSGMTLKIRPNGRPQSCIEDVNRDGRGDLVCHFVSSSRWWRASNTIVSLTGTLSDGTLIEGSDEICVQPCFGGWQIWRWHHR